MNELWDNPLISLEERFDILKGALAFRLGVKDKKITELEAELLNYKSATDLAYKGSDLEAQNRITELEAQNAILQEQLDLQTPKAALLQLQQENAALLVAIEVITHKLKPYPKLAHNTGYFHLQEFFDEVLTLSPSTELLEDRDRKRDAKLLRAAEEASDDDGFPVDIWRLADARESGEWKPELGD